MKTKKVIVADEQGCVMLFVKEQFINGGGQFCYAIYSKKDMKSYSESEAKILMKESHKNRKKYGLTPNKLITFYI